MLGLKHYLKLGCKVLVADLKFDSGHVSLRPILFITDLFQPLHHLAIKCFLNGDVGHRRRRRGPVPMLFTRLEPDDIPRSNLFDGTIPTLDQRQPAVTISVCPNGWVCQAVRAPWPQVTLAPAGVGWIRVMRKAGQRGPCR